ncbi:hypothetical protein [Paraburkholderia caribensis]|uniref:hypothetical protein n=1 Tax=Paraburkholderia caribensis TaxID=75105 RepID=UPI001CAF221D|nr:hypothetical protein [Paraburkholderia caribensis]CAG9256005.1 conserved hypothetical protein [Paraburkholderia caribensis]
MTFGISAGTAALIGGGLAAAGGVASAVISSNGAKSAANTQAQAAENAAQVQQQQYTQTRSDLQPYRDLGTSYIPQLKTALANPLLTATFSAPTAAQAAATPGYQFTLDNGLKAVQNSASARGLGASGAALKGASTYATGLADATYGDTYNRALQTFTTNQNTASNNVNRLLGIVGTGQNAAALTGSLGAQATNGIASSLTSAGAASAAGTVGSANAVNSGISSAVNGGTNALLLSSLLKNGGSTLYGGGATDAWGTM